MDAPEATKAFRAGRVRDARGRSVTQIDPIGMYLLHQHGAIDRRTLQQIANRPGLKMTGWERASLICGVVSALAVVSLFTVALITGDIRGAPCAKSASVIWMCCIPWIALYGIRQSRFRKVTGAMLEHRRCPHCGYDLRLLPPDPEDHTTVCPECGCAWRFSEDAVSKRETGETSTT